VVPSSLRNHNIIRRLVGTSLRLRVLHVGIESIAARGEGLDGAVGDISVALTAASRATTTRTPSPSSDGPFDFELLADLPHGLDLSGAHLLVLVLGDVEARATTHVLGADGGLGSVDLTLGRNPPLGDHVPQISLGRCYMARLHAHWDPPQGRPRRAA